jgi:4-hydroxybenzoate polyprenyltransferase
MKFPKKTQALLASTRLANLPSVVSNVWTGLVCSAIADDSMFSLEIPWKPALGLALAGSSLYLSGNFLNDWMDRRWDAQHRPERALPQGFFSPRLYLTLAVILGATGLACAAASHRNAGMVALGILLAIVIYTVFHKRSPWAVIAMGTCRALLPVMGAAALSPKLGILPIAFACALLCYIAGLSLSARYESLAHPPSWISPLARSLLIATAAISGIAISESGNGAHLLAGLLPYTIWISLSLSIWRKPVPFHVSRLLAGIPLADWILLLPIALLLSTSGAAASPLALACFAIPPLAFISALLLQRLAPAT